MSGLKVYGSLHIEMYVDVDVDRVLCIASAVKGVADRRGAEFRSYDMPGLLREVEGAWCSRGFAEAF